MATRNLESGTARSNNSRGGHLDTSEKQWTSWLVPAVVVVNIGVFISVMYVNNCPKNNLYKGDCVAKFLGRFSFQSLKVNPLLGPSPYTLEKMGAMRWYKVVYEDQGWRLITCMWLNAGIIHVLANMLSLVFIGIRLEQRFGFIRVGLIYLLSGFGGSILSALFIHQNVSAGVSGAGLLGATLSELLTNWKISTNKIAALLRLVIMIAFSLAVGILPHVDNFAHIGGFLTGFLLGFVLLLRPQFGWVKSRDHPPTQTLRVKYKHKPYQYGLWVSAMILLVAGFTLGLVMLFKGEDGNDHCSWCHYLRCVPIPHLKCFYW